jgi:hypothetical protein
MTISGCALTFNPRASRTRPPLGVPLAPLSDASIMSAISAPTSQQAPSSLPPSVFTLPQTAQLEALYTIIRDKTTSRADFLFYSDRIIRLLVEEGLNHLPVVPKTVETPTVR